MKKLFTLAVLTLIQSVWGTSFNFDWDDNIMHTPSKIVLFHKQSGEELTMDTEAFAVYRGQVGVEAVDYKGENLQEYTLIPEDGYSFRNFRDGANGENLFLQAVKEALEGPEASWQGPSWEDFVEALQEPETAEKTTIITARGHSPLAIYEAMELLQEMGYVEHVLPLENIYPTSNPGIFNRYLEDEVSAAHPSMIKVQVMIDLLDRLQAQPLDENASYVLSPDADKYDYFHLWGFSDDDEKTYQSALEVLSEEVAKQRWDRVKITVFYTGKSGSETNIIQSDGSLRSKIEGENTESATLDITADYPMYQMSSLGRWENESLG